MAKKSKQVEKAIEMDAYNVEIGSTIQDHKGNDVEVTEDIVIQMQTFEQANPKSHAIWKGKVTGTFLFYKYIEDHPEEKLKTKKKPGRKPKNVEELIEEEVVDEENLMLDCIADYQKEFNVSKVNVNTKKFKAFFEEWKQIE